RHVCPVRSALGMPTIRNYLGPLTNPAGVDRQVVGVADPRKLELVAYALHELGHARALVVHGEPGLDELSPLGVTEVLDVSPKGVRRYTLDARKFGWKNLAAADLAGRDPVDNDRPIDDVLAGKAT